MPELLFFKHDHSTQSVPAPSVAQLAALPKQFDLVTWQADGWPWSHEELTNAWFRIISWVDAIPANLDALLSPQLPAVDVNSQPTTYWLYRGFRLNVVGPSVPLQWLNWLNDDTRAQPKFVIPHGSLLTVTGVTLARPSVPISA